MRTRKGYSLIEIVIVILIIAILGASSAIVGTKQVARSRLQEATTFVQTMESNLEEGVTEMGFLDNPDFNSNLAGITAYLNELEDIYLNCLFDYTTEGDEASFKAISNLPSGFQGFQINIKTPMDPWGMEYTLFYMHGDAKDNYRIIIASPGPNNIWNEDGYNSGYVRVGDTSVDLIGDDVIDILISR